MSLRTKIIAHRGGRISVPENTLAAFRNALAIGVDGIELDVRRCATGELVVAHYSDLSEMTTSQGQIQDLSYEQIRQLDASAGLADFAGERIPLLSEVLALINGKVLLNIEVKTLPDCYPGIEDDLAAILADYPAEMLLLSSFDQRLLSRLKEKLPSIKQAILMRKFALNLGLNMRPITLPFKAKPLAWPDSLVLDKIGYCVRRGATAWHPSVLQVNADLVAAAHQAGIEINVWTANSEEQWAALVAMKVDGIITDDPLALQQFLKRK
jgi:glycerophosphoryl diester phosphodiesterase